MINICPNCKGIIGSDAVFCTKCGANIKALKKLDNTENIETTNSNSITSNNIQQMNNLTNNDKENYVSTSIQKTTRKYPFATIGAFCIVIALLLIIFGIALPIPKKHIDTWRTGAFGSEWKGDEYTEYVGGDAYNIMIEASLRGGIIAGRTIAKTILIVSGIAICITGTILIKIERKNS